jgi:hypothetical protein
MTLHPKNSVFDISYRSAVAGKGILLAQPVVGEDTKPFRFQLTCGERRPKVGLAQFNRTDLQP